MIYNNIVLRYFSMLQYHNTW